MDSGKPSERAVGAVTERFREHAPTAFWVRKCLEEAHDPALGLDRSVCLRDVVDALHEYESASQVSLTADEFVEMRFGRTETDAS